MVHSSPHHLYLIPGQFSDGRMFSQLGLGPEIETHVLEHIPVNIGEKLSTYARRMGAAIDTHQPYSLLGTSLGALIALEMSRHLHPEHVILVSGAKNRQEIPKRYRWFHHFPLYRVAGAERYKRILIAIRRRVEPEKEQTGSMAETMLAAKDPHFLFHSLPFITGFRNTHIPPNLLHIHGDQDTVMPFKHIRNAHVIKGGAHRLLLTHPEEISRLVKKQLLGS